MLRLAILFSAVACVLGAAIPDGLLPQSNGGRVVGGVPTTISAFPWQVSLQRNGAHSCGACIYSSNIAITAAHCLQNVVIKVMRIRAGSTFWNSGGVTIPVSAFLNHEDYNGATKHSDIGIIRLEFSLTFGSTIKPIPLASDAPRTGMPAVISGWGAKNYGSNSLPTILQYSSTFVVDEKDCGSSKYSYGSTKIDNTMICAASYDKDACQGDSGGPMVAGGELVGVVSWGTACALAKYPGVYANVAVLKSWVEKSIEIIRS